MQEQAGRTTTRLQRPRRISVFDGQDLKKAILVGAAWLEEHRDAINALNVFPVPDGDTGSNMSATMQAAIRGIVNSNETSAGVIAAKVAHGALMGARGNSGVILSQILRGLAQGLDKKQTFTATDLASAFNDAQRLAYRAVLKPVEGTILTVIHETAEAAEVSAKRGDDLVTLMQEIVITARQAVAQTPDLLPILKQAGVVDSGAQGLCTILEGIWRYVRGEAANINVGAQFIAPTPTSAVPTSPTPTPIVPTSPAPTLVAPTSRAPASTVPTTPIATPPPIESTSTEIIPKKGRVKIEEEFGYEVVFLLQGENLNVEGIRQHIIDMGGVSTVVAGDEKMLKVHTHTEWPGKILDYGVSLGSLLDINIENLQEQSLAYAAESEAEHNVGAQGIALASTPGQFLAPASQQGQFLAPSIETPLPATPHIATVAVVAGAGFEKVFEGLGVSAIVPGGQTMNPSTEELLSAVNAVTSGQVILLPNNSNVILSARQVLSLSDKEICIVPTDTLPQGIAALLAFNFEADFETNCKAMTEAAKSIQTAEITTAVRTTNISGVHVREGDFIGLVNGSLVIAGQNIEQVIRETLQRMNIDRYEIVTLYFGEDVTAEEAQETAKRIKQQYSHLEIEVVNGGQPYYAYIISAE